MYLAQNLKHQLVKQDLSKEMEFPWDYTDEEIEDEKNTDWSKSPHGKPIGTRFDPYHDVTVYEDGYEERYYIGD